MSAAAPEPVSNTVAEELLRLVPELAPHAAFLRRLLARIPLPGVDAAAYLVRRLGVLRQLPWVRPLGPNEWPAADVLAEIGTALASSALADRFSAFRARSTGLTQSHEAYTALVPRSGLVPSGHETLRAVLVQTLWTLEAPHQTPIAVLAQAIRGVSASAANPVGQLIGPITLATDRKQLADILETKVAGDELAGLPRGLVDMIRAYFVPVLRGERPIVHFERDRAATGAEPREPEPSAPTPPPSHPPSPETPTESKPRKKRGKDVRKRKKRTTAIPRGYQPHRPPSRPVRVRMRPRPGTDLEAGEPPSEVAPEPLLIDVGLPKGTADLRASVYRAHQSIRTDNVFLLPEHDAALSRAEARICTLLGLDQLEAAMAERAWLRARQWARLLLVVLTGKATSVLATTRVHSRVDDPPANRCVIDTARGCLIQPVYRPEQAYEPSKAERALLEPTATHLSLPLLPALVGAIMELRAQGADVFAGRDSDWDRDLLEPCRTLRESSGIPAFPGRLRTSFVCALVEAGNDVAATMLIVGDTLGQSEAPLYYYVPRSSDLEEVYLRAVENFSGECLPRLACGDRVGARTLLSESAARRLARSLGNGVHAGLADSDAGLVLLHRTMLTHTACMLMTVTGHRPCGALFRLQRWDFDLAAGHAIFSDKQGDPGHFFRFVALPELVCRQLRAYLAHLQGLLERSTGAVAQRCRAALEGSASLFFDVPQAADQPIELDLAAFRERLPAQWQRIRLNHGRTLIATLGREAGIAAPLILTQLGHYEAVGYPFSQDSPMRPAGFAKDVRTKFEIIAKRLGWRCLHGLTPSSERAREEPTPALRDWDVVSQRWEQHVRNTARETETQRRAAEKGVREQGLATALEVLSEIAPRLATYIAARHRARVAPADAEVLSEAQVEQLSEALIARAQGDAILTAASLRGLAQALATAARRMKWMGARPPYRISLPRDETVPFFPGMFSATRQMAVLRELAGRGFPASDTSCVPEKELAFGQVALLLIAMGRVDREDELLGLLTHRARLRRSERYPTIALVEWNHHPRRTTMVNGIAAAALGALARRYPGDDTPTLAALNRALSLLLPEAWAVSDAPALWCLLSTARAVHRVELSPLARLALDPEAGSTSASAEEQLAFIDGTPLRASPETSAKVEEDTSPSQRLDRYVAVRRMQKGARSDYRAVLACLPTGDSDTPLPLSQLTVSSVDRDRSRDLVRRELELRAADPHTHPTAMALALWAASLLAREARGSPIAISTVATYVSAVGGPLTTLADDVYPGTLDEDELTELLVDTVAAGSRTPATQARAAREALNFAAFCAAHLGWPDVDEDEFAPFLGRIERSEADACLLLGQQVDPAIEDLLSSSRFDASTRDNARSVRLRRQAAAGLVLMRAGGARRGEVLGLRLGDVRRGEAGILMQLAANGHRKLKTRRARRRLLLQHRVFEPEAAHLCTWLDAERQRLPTHRRDVDYVFSSLSDGKDLAEKSDVARIMASALAQASGRDNERLHRLRHLACCESFAHLAWAESSLRPPGHWRAPLAPVTVCHSVLLPRDLRRASLVMGHAGPITQVVHYLHLPWILRLAADADLKAHVTRAMAAAALARTLNGVDRVSQRRRPLDPVAAWVAHVVAVSDPRCRTTDVPPPAFTTDDVPRLAAIDVTYILDQVQEGVSPEVAGLVVGASLDQIAGLRLACDRYEELSGFRLLVRDGERRTRALSRSAHLYCLIDWTSGAEVVGAAEPDLLMRVVAEHGGVARHDSADVITMPVGKIDDLVRLVTLAGHPEDLIEVHEEGQLAHLRLDRCGVESRYSGRELRRIMAILWVWRNCQDPRSAGTV